MNKIVILIFLFSCNKYYNEEYFYEKDKYIYIECILNDSLVDFYDYIGIIYKDAEEINSSINRFPILKNKILIPQSVFVKTWNLEIFRNNKTEYSSEEYIVIDSFDIKKYDNHWKIIIDEFPHSSKYSSYNLEEYIKEGLYLLIPLKSKDSVEVFSTFY